MRILHFFDQLKIIFKRCRLQLILMMRDESKVQGSVVPMFLLGRGISEFFHTGNKIIICTTPSLYPCLLRMKVEVVETDLYSTINKNSKDILRLFHAPRYQQFIPRFFLCQSDPIATFALNLDLPTKEKIGVSAFFRP